MNEINDNQEVKKLNPCGLVLAFNRFVYILRQRRKARARRKAAEKAVAEVIEYRSTLLKMMGALK